MKTPHLFPAPRPCLSDQCHGGPIPAQCCDCPECRGVAYAIVRGIAQSIRDRRPAPKKEAR